MESLSEIVPPEVLGGLFPRDARGERSRNGAQGNAVVFRVGGREIETDISTASGQRVSPRSSFSSFLRQVRPQERKRLRITRVADRLYEVDYPP
jgi:hypothetical protein